MISSAEFEACYNLGNEYDIVRLNEIKSFLLTINAKQIDSWSGHGGSQEIEQTLYLYKDEKVLLEIETYGGIRLYANPQLVKQFSKELG